MGLSYGIMTGISSPMIVLLTSDKSPLPCGRITQARGILTLVQTLSLAIAFIHLNEPGWPVL